MAWLEIIEWHDMRHARVYFLNDPRNNINKQWRPNVVIEISDEEATTLSSEELLKKYDKWEIKT